ncbi:hypothetical protein R1flu_009866 [Riccia fluitans]|uniref:No apical meristem-associated C-terminal domain-containing protein n=1 Tax=Riccia fluitans TaxID=41844 RepID=A0ABD1Z4F6_9MARC
MVEDVLFKKAYLYQSDEGANLDLSKRFCRYGKQIGNGRKKARKRAKAELKPDSAEGKIHKDHASEFENMGKTTKVDITLKEVTEEKVTSSPQRKRRSCKIGSNIDKVYKENDELEVKMKMAEEQYAALQVMFAEEQEKTDKLQKIVVDKNEL